MVSACTIRDGGPEFDSWSGQIRVLKNLFQFDYVCLRVSECCLASPTGEI